MFWKPFAFRSVVVRHPNVLFMASWNIINMYPDFVAAPSQLNVERTTESEKFDTIREDSFSVD